MSGLDFFKPDNAPWRENAKIKIQLKNFFSWNELIKNTPKRVKIFQNFLKIGLNLHISIFGTPVS